MLLRALVRPLTPSAQPGGRRGACQSCLRRRTSATAEHGDEAAALFLVDLRAPGVSRAAVATIDPTRSHARIAFDRAAGERLGEPGGGALRGEGA